MAEESATLTLRLPAKTKAKLEKLAQMSGRTKSWWAAAAIEAYVDYQTPIVKGILKAQESLRAGKAHTTDEVFAEVDAIIKAAEAAQAPKRK